VANIVFARKNLLDLNLKCFCPKKPFKFKLYIIYKQRGTHIQKMINEDDAVVILEILDAIKQFPKSILRCQGFFRAEYVLSSLSHRSLGL